MKSTVSICQVFAVLTFSVVQLTASQELDCTARPNGLYPHLGDCGRYYECHNSLTYTHVCPATLHFNQRLSICDWAESAGCTVTDFTTESAVATEATATVKPELQFDCAGRVGRPCGFFPDPENCQNFYQCTEGEKIIHRQCPEQLYYNPDLQLCDLAGRVHCGELNCENREDGNYQNMENCHTYIACSNKNTYVMPCPANLVYHPDSNNMGWCDYTENASQFCVNGELD